MADQIVITKPGTPDLAALTDLLASLPECMGGDMDAALGASARLTTLSCADVVEVAEELGIDFGLAPFSAKQLHVGMEIEAGQRDPGSADLLDEDLLDLGRIAVINLQRQGDYYAQLTTAHAPGDPPPVAYHVDEVGAD